jgi:hypothetical protein
VFFVGSIENLVHAQSLGWLTGVKRNVRSCPSSVVKEGHKPEIHVQLLMAVK